MLPDYPNCCPPSRAAWREWLSEHHEQAAGVWLIFYKKGTGQPTLTYDEAVREALCFGWIDSRPAKIDAERHALKFTPRKPKSGWSKLNKTRLKELEAEGMILPAGQRAIDLAKANGSWSLLDEIENLTMPDELAAALDALPPARANFEAFAVSVKKGILAWVTSAKRPETKAKRIAEVVENAARNRKAGPFLNY